MTESHVAAPPARPATAAVRAGAPAADRTRPSGPDLRARQVVLAYDQRVVVDGVDLAVPPGRITVIVGANACGKSTLLRGLARLLQPRGGSVLLDGRELHRTPTRDVARRIGLLPQSPVAPEGVVVGDLIARGRSPHQRWWQQWSAEDQRAVDEALAATSVTDLADRPVDELSGGQRQRVWLALALAQDPEVLLLGEPTTYLDMAHQVEVLELVAELNLRRGRTVVMVLHDLNHAARYAHHVVAMKDGRVVAEGPPAEVVTEELVADVFGLDCAVVPCPVSAHPLVIHRDRHGARPVAR
ncbi:ABC transporter ATP-binding protein [Blastococcus sp. SYSU DS0510]